MADTFEIVDLHVRIEEREILKGLNLTLSKGEVHALMGPNGSGKSTLANALMGNSKYPVTAGKILMKGENVLDMTPDERARKGLFLAFQYPCEVPGVRMANFLRLACNARAGRELEVMEFYSKLEEQMKFLEIDENFMKRYLNEGFSGGEKKRNEILQMMMLQPEFAIMDETDSGLDIDALRIVSRGVNELRGPDLGILIITHYERILRYIKPDFIHIMVDGRIAKSGGADLAAHLEEHGYDWITKEAEPAPAIGEIVMSPATNQILPGQYKEGFHDDLKALHTVPKGPSHDVVDYMCDVKGEPDWMRDFRHRSLDLFLKQGLPAWLPGLRDDIDYDEITYYVSPVEKSANRWEDVPEEIRRTYDKLGIAKEEQKLLGGLGAQIDSEMAYHNIQESLAKKGIVFLSCDDGLKQYPDIFKEHFAKSIPPEDNKFAALNSAFWSGGSFVYVPKGVKCDIPLSVYFRINAEQFGQFERTLIICDDDSLLPLRRRLQRAGLHHQLAARRGRGDFRQGPRPLPLHDHPELEHRRVQPRDQARLSLQERRHGMGGRQPRLETHREISVVLLARRRRATAKSSASPPPTRACGRTPAPSWCSTRRTARAASTPNPSAATADAPRIAAWSRSTSRRKNCRVQVNCDALILDERQPLRHVSGDGNRRRPRHGRTRSQRLERFRRAALLSDEPRHQEGGRGLDDRQRIHRTDREGTPHGICRRDQSPDQSADGRQRRLERFQHSDFGLVPDDDNCSLKRPWKPLLRGNRRGCASSDSRRCRRSRNCRCQPSVTWSGSGSICGD